jgi:hypothetical protein
MRLGALVLIMLAGIGLGGCGDSGGSPVDGAVTDAPHADAASTADAPAGVDAPAADAPALDAPPDAPAGDDGGDDAAPLCTRIDSWPALNASAESDGSSLTYALSYAQASGPFTILEIDAFFDAGQTYPLTRTAMATDHYSDCPTCVILSEGCDEGGSGCTADFFAVGGTITVTQADLNADMGRMIASAANLRLLEWNLGSDVAVPNGRCYEVGSVSIDEKWDFTTPDGGVDSDGGNLRARRLLLRAATREPRRAAP